MAQAALVWRGGGPLRGEISRRGFMRRMLGAGGGVLLVDTSEFITGPAPGTATVDTRAPTEVQHCVG